jgi:hypothetical protein
MSNINRAELLSNIEKQLSITPMSRVQIMEHFQKGKTVITVCLDTLRKYKRIYICSHIVDGRSITPMYKTGSLPDAVHVPKLIVRQKRKLKPVVPIYVVPRIIKHHELIEWIYKCQQI